jgi:hypothetical protein
MRLVAAIEDPDVARKILECLDLPARAPPLALAEPEGSAWNNSECGDEEPPFAVDPAHPDGWA